MSQFRYKTRRYVKDCFTFVSTSAMHSLRNWSKMPWDLTSPTIWSINRGSPASKVLDKLNSMSTNDDRPESDFVRHKIAEATIFIDQRWQEHLVKQQTQHPSRPCFFTSLHIASHCARMRGSIPIETPFFAHARYMRQYGMRSEILPVE